MASSNKLEQIKTGSRKKTEHNSSHRAATNATMSSYQQYNLRASNIYSPKDDNRTKTIDKENNSVIFNDMSIQDEKMDKIDKNEK